MWGVNKSHGDEMKDKQKIFWFLRFRAAAWLTHSFVDENNFQALLIPGGDVLPCTYCCEDHFRSIQTEQHQLHLLVCFQIVCNYSSTLSKIRHFHQKHGGKKRKKIMLFVQLDWNCCIFSNQMKELPCVYFFLFPRHTESKVPSPRTASQMPPLPSWQDINKYTESMQLPLRPVYWNVFSLHFWRTAGSAIYSNFPSAREPRCEWFHAMCPTVPLNFALPFIPHP